MYHHCKNLIEFKVRNFLKIYLIEKISPAFTTTKIVVTIKIMTPINTVMPKIGIRTESEIQRTEKGLILNIHSKATTKEKQVINTATIIR